MNDNRGESSESSDLTMIAIYYTEVCSLTNNKGENGEVSENIFHRSALHKKIWYSNLKNSNWCLLENNEKKIRVLQLFLFLNWRSLLFQRPSCFPLVVDSLHYNV